MTAPDPVPNLTWDMWLDIKKAGDRICDAIYGEWTPDCPQWQLAEQWEQAAGKVRPVRRFR